MDTMKAFMMGKMNRGKESMVFDWHKAARRIKESGCQSAQAGLAGDWNCTGGMIFSDGKPYIDDCCYLASTWATPELELDDGRREDCFIMKSEIKGEKWDADTRWPESALKILNAEE